MGGVRLPIRKYTIKGLPEAFLLVIRGYNDADIHPYSIPNLRQKGHFYAPIEPYNTLDKEA